MDLMFIICKGVYPNTYDGMNTAHLKGTLLFRALPYIFRTYVNANVMQLHMC